MTRKSHTFLGITATLFCCCGFKGCDFGYDASANKFVIVANEELVPYIGSPNGVKIPLLFTRVQGNFYSATQFTANTGSSTSYDANTSLTGIASPVDNKMGMWNHRIFLPHTCGTNLPYTYSLGSYIYTTSPNPVSMSAGTPGNTFEWDCQTASANFPQAATRFVDLSGGPSAVTFSSEGVALTNTYGMPSIYLSGDQNFNGGSPMSVSASSISPDQTAASFSLPTNIPGGLYGISLVNQNANGPSYAGSNFVSVSSRMSFPAPYGIGAQTVTTDTTSVITEDSNHDGTCSGGTSSYETITKYGFPIVTEYTTGKVNSNGAEVAVGANPTSILLYNYANQFTQNQITGPCSYDQIYTKQFYNAAVVNSGSDTVSLLDISNSIYPVVTTTIQVGSNPVALAISANGQSLFVVNNGNSTISKIDLSSNSVTTSGVFGVGLSSVDVASDGTLWLGTSSSLIHVSSSTLQPIATYSTNGKAVLATKFNGTNGELVLTTSDSSGNVLIQEVDANNTVSSQAMVTNASHQVSTLPSASSGSPAVMAQRQVGQFPGIPVDFASGTFSGQTIDDNWLTLSVTPSGFVVTDTANHISLMSGATPGFVTSAAVDPEEGALYLAVPDQNLVMWVPIPSN